MNHSLPEPLVSSRPRWTVLGFLLAGAAMFAALVVRRNRRVSDNSFDAFGDTPVGEWSMQPVVTGSSAQPHTLPPPRVPIPVQQGHFSARRWLAFVFFTLALIVGLMALQDSSPSVSITLFTLLIVGSLALAVWRTPQVIYRLTHMVVAVAHVVSEISIWGATTPLSVMRDLIRPIRGHLSATAAWLSVLVMLVAAGTFWYMAAASGSMTTAVMLVIIGTLLMGVSVSLRPNLTHIVQIERVTERTKTGLGWIVTGLGVITLAVLAEMNGNVFHLEAFASVNSNVQFGMLIVGIALLVAGLGGLRILPYIYTALLDYLRPLQPQSAVVGAGDSALSHPRSISSKMVQSAGTSGAGRFSTFFSALTTRYALLFVTLLAFILRFWELNHVYRFFIDELLNIDAVMYILGNHDAPLLAPFSSIAAFPYIFPYWQTAGVLVFGQTYMGVRAASAVLGALAVPGLYLLAKTLFDHKTAFIAALLLATFPPHLQFSRMGINEMGGPLFATFAFLFLARGVLHNRRFDYALGGALLGLTHYFDEGSRLLFTPMIALWMMGLLILWKPRGRLRNYFIVLIALLAVAVPIYYTLNGLKLPVAARMVDNSSGLNGGYWSVLFQSSNLQQHINNHLIPAFMVYFNQLDGTLFYRGETALLLVYVMPFFLLGLAYLLWHWRSPGALLFLLWVFCVSFGNSILVASASYPRFVIVFPAIALVVAVGIRYVVPLVLQPERLRRWQTSAIMVLGISLAFLQANYYFTEHIPTFSQQFRDNWPHPDAEDGILRSFDLPLGAELHFVSEVPPDVNYNIGAASFLNNRVFVDTRTPAELTPTYFLKLTCGVEHVFFLNSDDFESLRRIQRYFTLDNAQWSPYDDIPPRKQFVMFRAHDLPGSASIYTNRCS